MILLLLVACAEEWPGNRYSHVGALGPDGSLWVAGGSSGEGKRLDAWSLDLSTGLWTQQLAPPEPIFRSTLSESDGVAWVFGGSAAQNLESDRLYRWDLGDGTWTLEDEGGGPQGRYKAASAWGEGLLYLQGGRWDDEGGTLTLDELWSWSPDTGLWTSLGGGGPGAITRQALAWEPEAGQLWCHGGLDGESTRLDSLWRYTPGLGWEQVTPSGTIPEQRASHSLVAWEGALYLWGGHPSDTSLWRFDPGQLAWTELPAAESPAPRDAFVAALHADSGLLTIMGGDPFSEEGLPEFSADVWTLNLVDGQWTRVGEGGL